MTDKKIVDVVDGDAQAFAISKIYTKDISFESPGAPEIFAIPDQKPELNINISVENRQLDTDYWEVALKVSVISRNPKSEKVVFEIEIEHAAMFLIQNIDKAHMPMLLAVDCPAILLPYTRQIISQLTIDGGFAPLLLEPVNFMSIYEYNLGQAEKQLAESKS